MPRRAPHGDLLERAHAVDLPLRVDIEEGEGVVRQLVRVRARARARARVRARARARARARVRVRIRVRVRVGVGATVIGVLQLPASQVLKSLPPSPVPPHASECAYSWKRKRLRSDESPRLLGWSRLMTPKGEPPPTRLSRLLFELAGWYWSSTKTSRSTHVPSDMRAILPSRIVPAGPLPPPSDGQLRAAREALTACGMLAHTAGSSVLAWPPRKLHAV